MNKNSSATMGPNLNLHDYHRYDEEVEEEDDNNDDALSLCDLPIHDSDDEEFDHSEVSYQSPNKYSSDQDLFEFFTNPKSVPQITDSTNQIVFCGKIIQHKQDQSKPPPPTLSFDHFNRSDSLRNLSLKPAAIGNDRFSSSTLSRSQSRRRPFTFGLVKFPPEMELSDMRKRQSRRPPAPMFPAGDGDRESAMTSSGCGRGGRGGNWGGLFRLLKGRSHLGSALAKTSLGCISLV